ncbi:uncharacterized protein PHALS_02167 [Plasmopara halstedii]|uniref:Uncharacterized protein n=1 Tax=Plasmopara halstedii TaxID=4781 RepID=A0A0P1A737_PLAHL|nr:uncharacterized protein PHALS_02167 [Plasmopara halstedii]CEG36254.1 hypothetical protein PHALS_02167 [Plasmopara halstedii]|eukprot:XP_024572623.1 hypothetical protein PHALS_02167 [Plasmopara halstedii]
MAHNVVSCLDEHFEHLRANLIRCEECNENFFFDFLRHPRYFVTHFKLCHLKNVLYRINGCTEEENQRVRFGPRRKKDAITWFSQLKSTEKRMISMQDNKWGEIVECECWSCHLCKQARKGSEMPHAFEPNEVGRQQALGHLQHKRRREQLTPAQRQLDAERRARKRQRMEERTQSQGRRTQASSEVREREMKRSRARRQHATEQQRQREAQRSRVRRLNATEDQRRKERERCRRRYQVQKQRKIEMYQNDTCTHHAGTIDQTRVVSVDLTRRNEHLVQQQARLGLEIQSLCASLSTIDKQVTSSEIENDGTKSD